MALSANQTTIYVLSKTSYMLDSSTFRYRNRSLITHSYFNNVTFSIIKNKSCLRKLEFETCLKVWCSKNIHRTWFCFREYPIIHWILASFENINQYSIFIGSQDEFIEWNGSLSCPIRRKYWAKIASWNTIINFFAKFTKTLFHWFKIYIWMHCSLCNQSRPAYAICNTFLVSRHFRKGIKLTSNELL